MGVSAIPVRIIRNRKSREAGMKNRAYAAVILAALTLTTAACGSTGGTQGKQQAASSASSAATATASTSAAANTAAADASSAAASAVSTEASSSAVTAAAGTEASDAAASAASISAAASSGAAAADAVDSSDASGIMVTSIHQSKGVYDTDNSPVISTVYYELGMNNGTAGENTDYPALKTALDSYNAELKKRMEGMVSDYADDAKADKKEQGSDFQAYQENSSIKVLRADSTVFSFLETCSTYTGGAHSNTVFYSHNYDTASGTELKLTDVIPDTSMLPDILGKKLDRDYSDATWLVDNVSDTIRDELSGKDPDTAIAWTLGPDGITFWFEPYHLASYADGTQQVTLPYSAYADLFSEKYAAASENYVVPIDFEASYNLPGESLLDSSIKYFQVSEDPDPDQNLINVTVTYGNSQKKLKVYGYKVDAYLFCDNGFRYLCLNTVGDDDWQSAYFVPMSGGSIGSMVSCSWGFYENVPTDPENFMMETRCYLLSTYGIDTRFRLGAGGKPKTLDTMAYLPTLPADAQIGPLTTKQEMKVHILDSADGDAVSQATLPKGTKLYFYRTDARDIVDMKTEDGRIVRFRVDSNIYPILIDGVYTEDCFDGAFYAG